MLYGVDIVTTANELGHANATTTANIYAHQIAMAKAKKRQQKFCSLWCYVGYLSSALAIASWKSLASVKISCL